MMDTKLSLELDPSKVDSLIGGVADDRVAQRLSKLRQEKLSRSATLKSNAKVTLPKLIHRDLFEQR